jgi:ABC-type amino acid transport substrate-binding protein
VVRQSQPLTWTKLEQLKGFRLGWSRGYSYGEALDQLRPNLQITEMGNDELALKRLYLGSVDAVPMDPLVARQLIATLFNEQEAKQLLIDLAPQHTIEKTELHVVCAQTSPSCAATIEQFNRGLKQRGDGHTPACGE